MPCLGPTIQGRIKHACNVLKQGRCMSTSFGSPADFSGTDLRACLQAHMKGRSRKGQAKDADEVRASRAEARAEKRSAREIQLCLCSVAKGRDCNAYGSIASACRCAIHVGNSVICTASTLAIFIGMLRN